MCDRALLFSHARSLLFSLSLSLSFRPAPSRPTQLFRIYAHLYHGHMHRVVELTFEAHLNSCFKHFLYFSQE